MPLKVRDYRALELDCLVPVLALSDLGQIL